MIARKTFDKEIRHIVNQLVSKYKPEKVILFGSLIHSAITEGTDIDLFIIKQNVPRNGVDRIREVQRMVNHRLATDFIVYSPNEVQKRIAMKDPFVIQTLEEGKVLYSAERNSQRVDTKGG